MHCNGVEPFADGKSSHRGSCHRPSAIVCRTVENRNEGQARRRSFERGAGAIPGRNRASAPPRRGERRRRSPRVEKIEKNRRAGRKNHLTRALPSSTQRNVRQVIKARSVQGGTLSPRRKEELQREAPVFYCIGTTSISFSAWHAKAPFKRYHRPDSRQDTPVSSLTERSTLALMHVRAPGRRGDSRAFGKGDDPSGAQLQPRDPRHAWSAAPIALLAMRQRKQGRN
jgi:hypothetical protein